MSKSEKLTNTVNTNILTYLPPELHEGKECYVDYYVINPLTSTLHRKKIKLNKIKHKMSVNEFRRYVRILIKNINEKLVQGWNPFLNQESGQGFTLLTVALQSFVDTKTRELTKNSMRSYRSFVSKINDFLDKHNKTDYFVISFNKADAVNMLNEIWLSGIEAKTYNSHKGAFHSIWGWFIEMNYSNVNVFDGFKSKKEREKKRIEIPSTLRGKIKSHCNSNNMQAYWLMCELAFYCLLRPAEICRLTRDMVDLENSMIILPGTESKNAKTRAISIAEHIKPLLVEQLKTPGNIIFADNKKFTPGPLVLDSRKIAKQWNKLRITLNFEQYIQFYSLRDSGIIYLLDNVVSAETVRDQADHYSLEQTTKYSKRFRPRGHSELKTIKPDC